MRKKVWFALVALVAALLTACGNGSADRRDAFVMVDWRDFTLTNASGKRLVRDHDRGDYPKGSMQHGEFSEYTGTPASLGFQVPHSERFVFTRDGGEFSCNLSAETYGGGANADEFCSLELSAEGIVLTGMDTDFYMTLDLTQEGLDSLNVRSHTLEVAAMSQEGSIVTISGLEGKYTLELWKEVGYWQDPIEGTTETGTLVIDLSRVMEENILTITDGETTIEHEVKKS